MGDDDHDHDEEEEEDKDEGGGDARKEGSYKLELVLRKWFAIDPSREMRAFVREGVLVGASRPSIHPLVLSSLRLRKR